LLNIITSFSMDN